MKHQLCEFVTNDLNDILDRVGVDILLGSSLMRAIVTLGNVDMYTVFLRSETPQG